jgi:hypothetical protein
VPIHIAYAEERMVSPAACRRRFQRLLRRRAGVGRSSDFG